MKRTIVIAALCATFCACARTLDLNGTWEFAFEENVPLAQAGGADFVATDKMSVPGCYDAMPKWYLKRGTGLYRRTFRLERDEASATLVIDGMGLVGKFGIDGREIATSTLPYVQLRFDVGALKAGTHTIFAALDNRLDWSSFKLGRPYYDFYLYGGFYHGVSLDFESRRLRVRTRDWKTGEIELEVAGDFADGEREVTFDGGKAVRASFLDRRARVRVPDFKLWSPDHPNLHTVNVDGVSARFGIRTVEARDGRIWLNGEPLYLKGANRHESHPTFGAATPETLMMLDIQNLKALGGNFFRGAHYPQSQRFLDMCDECGVLVWEESLGWGNGQTYTDTKQVELKDAKFRADQLSETAKMVEASFNHPSVIIFAFLNEFASANPAWKGFADELIAKIRSYDSGRLVSFACNNNSNDVCNDKTDVIAFNTYPGWIGSEPGSAEHLKSMIGNDVAGIVKFYRKRYPTKPIMVSEMGTCGVYGQHDEAAAQWTEEFEAEYLRDAIEAVFNEPQIAGFTIWQFADSRSYHRDGGSVRGKPFAENLAGLYDGYRRPKKIVTDMVRREFTDIKR